MAVHAGGYGTQLINQAFQQKPVSRELLANGVARCIVFDLLDKQIAKSPELLAERLHKKLLNHIKQMDKKAEHKKDAAKEKSVQKVPKVPKKEKTASL